MRLKAARMRLHAIMTRACTDPAFMQQLRADPTHVLVDEGLPYDVIEDFLRETGMQAEVSGFAIAECATTCAVTKRDNYPKEFKQ